LLTVAQFTPVATILIILSIFAMPTPLVAMIMAPVLGGLIGFAPYNKPVAKLFLGDTGSLVIGLVGGYALYRVATDISFFAAVIIPSLCSGGYDDHRHSPFDARGEDLDAASQPLFQRATTMGWSVKQIVGIVFVLNIFLAFCGWMAAHATTNTVTMIAFMMALGAVLVTLRAFTRAPSEVMAPSSL